MYRLVNFPCLRISRHRSIPSKGCSLCGIYNSPVLYNLKGKIIDSSNIQFLRYQTTGTDLLCSEEITKRKRYKRNKRYFTELLEVYSDNSKASISETRASVRKLKPGDISRIASSPGIQLDHLHKIKNKSVQNNKKTHEEVKENENGNTHQENTHFANKEFIATPNTLPSSALSALNVKEEGVHLTNKLSDENFTNLPETSDSLLRQDKNVVPDELEEELQDQLNTFHDPIEAGLSIPRTELETRNIVDEFEHEMQSDDLENIGTDTPTSNLTPPAPKKHDKRKEPRYAVTKENLAKERFSELEKKAREKTFNTTLYSYLKLCIEVLVSKIAQYEIFSTMVLKSAK